MTNPHTINWFEVPVKDITRATKFYETVLSIKMEKMEMEGMNMTIFPSLGESNTMTVHGALVQCDGYTPSVNGTVIYFNGGADLATPLAKVEAAGGKVLMPKSSIGEHGYCAWFEDTEGNRLGLHSMN